MEQTTWVPREGPAPVPVDFNWMPDKDLVGLNTRRTEEVLSQRGIVLRDGLILNVWDADEDAEGRRNDLIVSGHVESRDGIWVLRFREPLHWQSDEQDAPGAS